MRQRTFSRKVGEYGPRCLFSCKNKIFAASFYTGGIFANTIKQYSIYPSCFRTKEGSSSIEVTLPLLTLGSVLWKTLQKPS